MNSVLKAIDVAVIDFTVRKDRTIGYDYGWSLFWRSSKSKHYPWIYFSNKYSDAPEDVIDSATYHPRIANLIAGSKLFISSESKLSRDLVRNSGYTITYSRDKADFVIVPPFKSCGYAWDVDLIVRNTESDKLFLCTISNRCNSYTPSESDYIREIAAIEKKPLSIYEGSSICPTYSKYKVTPVRDVKEFVDILSGSVKSSNMILDSDLPLTPSVNISVETLDLWARLANSDENMFEKSVLNSDVREYPFTFYCFMHCEPLVKWNNYRGLNWLLNSMGIKDDYTMEINPKDLEMLQKWALYRLGVSENGGYSPTQDALYGDYNDYLKYVRKRIAIMPVKCDKPISVNNLLNLAKE